MHKKFPAGDTVRPCAVSYTHLDVYKRQVLHSVIIPLLPLYVCGTFIDMTKSGKTYAILGILWKVFLVVIIMQDVYKRQMSDSQKDDLQSRKRAFWRYDHGTAFSGSA